MTYYKVLNGDGSACHGGRGKWSLPRGKRPGAWMPQIKGRLVPCENGYHVCRRKDLIHWLGVAIFEVEVRSERVAGENKIVARDARLLRRIDTWNERTARLFAADCAEMVLPIFERRHLGDTRPRDAIAAARAFARGEIGAAAWDAARTAAWDAARTAAWDAAWDAASAAAMDAASAAAWDAMSRRLHQYLAGEEPHTKMKLVEYHKRQARIKRAKAKAKARKKVKP